MIQLKEVFDAEQLTEELARNCLMNNKHLDYVRIREEKEELERELMLALCIVVDKCGAGPCSKCQSPSTCETLKRLRELEAKLKA